MFLTIVFKSIVQATDILIGDAVNDLFARHITSKVELQTELDLIGWTVLVADANQLYE